MTTLEKLVRNPTIENFNSFIELHKMPDVENIYYNCRNIFHVAISNNRPDYAIKFLEECSDIHYSIGGNTYLHYSVKFGYKDITEMLIKKGLDLNLLNKNGNSCLNLALIHGHLDLAKYLVENRADINTHNENNNTALYICVENNYKEMLILLLEMGADTSIEDNRGLTPLYLAITKNNIEMVRLLLDNGSSIYSMTDLGHNALKLAIYHNRLEILDIILERIRDKDPLYIDLLDFYERAALHIAAGIGYCEMIERLLENNADIERRGCETPLWSAVKYSKIPSIKLLVLKGANVNALVGGRSLLHISIKDTEIVTILLDAGIDIDRQDTEGNTALHLAVYSNYTETTRLLLSRGASMTIENNEKILPMHYIDVAKFKIKDKNVR